VVGGARLSPGAGGSLAQVLERCRCSRCRRILFELATGVLNIQYD